MQIQIYNDKTIGAEINSANAREIFQFLNSEQEYANWIKIVSATTILLKIKTTL